MHYRTRDSTGASRRLSFRLTPLLHILLVLWCLEANRALCAAGDDAVAFALTIGARRNSTGGWLVTVDTESDTRLTSRSGFTVKTFLAAARNSNGRVVHLSSSFATQGNKHPAQYEAWGGDSYYRLYTDALPWDAAQKHCMLDGAHLIVLDSETEESVVREMFARKLSIRNASTVYYYHAGIHNRYDKGKLVTTFGDPVPSWAAAKITDAATDSNRCGRVVAEGIYARGDCTAARAFICEYDSIL